MAYETLANLKTSMNRTDNTDDAILSLFLDAATTAIDRFCNRSGGSFVAITEAVARFYRGSGTNWQQIDECVEITAVAVKDSVTDAAYTAWTTPTTPMAGDGDWMPFSGDPDDADFNGLPFDALLIDPNGDQSVFTGGGSVPQDFFFAGALGRTRRSLAGTNLGRVPTVQVTARWGYAIEVPDDIRTACRMQAAIWFKRSEGSMASALGSSEFGTLEVFKTMDPAIEMILVLGRYTKPAIGRR